MVKLPITGIMKR